MPLLTTAPMYLLKGKSFSMVAKKEYSFIVTGEVLNAKKITNHVDQKRGYSNSILFFYRFSWPFFLIAPLSHNKGNGLKPPKTRYQLGKDLKDLIRNRPWIILLLIGVVI